MQAQANMAFHLKKLAFNKHIHMAFGHLHIYVHWV